MTTLRLVLRQHRWVVVFAVLLCLVLAGAALFAWSALAGVSTPAHCIEDRFLDPIPTECIGTEDFLTRNEELAGKVMAAMAVLPLLLGILVGVPLVGSEIETRTATIAWSLGPSRRRWLAVRLAILGLGLAVVLAVPAIAAQVLENVRPNYADYDPSTTVLLDYGLRGPLVVFRGLAAFAIGVTIGLALGRVLPALLVSGVAVVVLWNVLGMAMNAGWPAPELVVREPDRYYMEYGFSDGDGVTVGAQEYLDASGTRVSYGEIVQRSGLGDPNDPKFDYAELETWMADHGIRPLINAVDGGKLGFVETREAMGLTLLTALLLGGSVLLIEWRRPA